MSATSNAENIRDDILNGVYYGEENSMPRVSWLAYDNDEGRMVIVVTGQVAGARLLPLDWALMEAVFTAEFGKRVGWRQELGQFFMETLYSIAGETPTPSSMPASDESDDEIIR